MLHLNKDSVAARGRKTVGELDGVGDRLIVHGHIHAHACVHGRSALIGQHQRGHGSRALWMGMRKGSAVSLNERGVPRHPHVRLHIWCRVSVGVQQAETEAVSGVGRQDRRAVPYHDVAIGEFVGVAQLPFT